jgi:hypothetical protein
MSKSFNTADVKFSRMYPMLELIHDNIWHKVHAFTANGLPITSRMTVVRLPDGKLLVHSPIPLGDNLHRQIDSLGSVAFIVAPNKMHYLFLASFSAAFPGATVYGPKGLLQKRPELGSVVDLPHGDVLEWKPDLEHHAFAGIPAGNESIWFHRPSATLIVTDLLQWMQGDLAWSTKTYAVLTGVRRRLAVPRTVRALVRDRAAASESARHVLSWPFTRVVTAHNAILTEDAYEQVARALSVF